MKTIGGLSFPETSDEAKDWAPRLAWRALDSRILVAAKTRVEGTWAAYIAPVPGEDHDAEYREVLKTGTKLEQEIAVVIFPYFAGIPYAH
jgi:hypothetical protein